MSCLFADYTPKVKERLPEQFKNSAKLIGFLEATIDKELQSVQCDLMTQRWLNSAIGKQLDGIGEIVGHARPRLPVSEDGNFGFELDDTAREFGDLFTIENGGFLGSVNPPLVDFANDDIYRILIKAKILRNSSNMSVDSTINILKTIFNANVSYFLPTNLNPMYEIGREFYSFERDLLSLFPTTLGIGTTIYATYSEEGAFGFDGDSDALEFGDTINPDSGGYLASIIIV